MLKPFVFSLGEFLSVTVSKLLNVSATTWSSLKIVSLCEILFEKSGCYKNAQILSYIHQVLIDLNKSFWKLL